MNEKYKNKLIRLINLICIFTVVVPNFIKISNKVYAIATGPGTIEPGTSWEIPDKINQFGATDERYDGIHWNYSQGEVNEKLWKAQGSKSERGWAYVEIAGEKRYLIALSQEFGWSGDYVDVTVREDDGTETIYPCLLGDSKGQETPGVYNGVNRGAYIYDGIQWGHWHPTEDSCNVLELLRVGEYTSDFTGNLLPSLRVVTRIQNGGSWFDHPDGPIGLDGGYGKSRKENSTFQGFLGGNIRTLWISLATAVENLMNKREDTTVFYVLEEDEKTLGNGDIVAACEEVTKMLLARGCKYPPGCDWSYLDFNRDIKNQLFNNNYFCCATYVASVLYYAGALSEEEINAYNYHWTGAGGIPSMLEAAGWTNVAGKEDPKPGDVINKNGVHVLIYAGDGLCWDQSSAVVSSSGNPPSGTKKAYDLTGCEIWRKPN